MVGKVSCNEKEFGKVEEGTTSHLHFLQFFACMQMGASAGKEFLVGIRRGSDFRTIRCTEIQTDAQHHYDYSLLLILIALSSLSESQFDCCLFFI